MILRLGHFFLAMILSMLIRCYLCPMKSNYDAKRASWIFASLKTPINYGKYGFPAGDNLKSGLQVGSSCPLPGQQLSVSGQCLAMQQANA